MLYLARLLIDEGRAAGISPQARLTGDNVAQQRNYRGACVTSPPLDSFRVLASGSGPRLFFVGEHPVDRGAGVDRGRVVDRDDVGADIDREHQLGAAQHHRLDLLLGELGDQRLELALAVADDPPDGELLEDDPVDLLHPQRARSAPG